MDIINTILLIAVVLYFAIVYFFKYFGNSLGAYLVERRAKKEAMDAQALEDQRLAWRQRIKDIHSGKINVI